MAHSIFLSKLWYIGRLKYLERKKKNLPKLTLGTHRGLLIVKYKDARRIHEINEHSIKWPQVYSAYLTQQELTREYERLKRELQEIHNEKYDLIKHQYSVIQQQKIRMNSNDWDSLVDNECEIANDKDNFFDGHNFRSRIEMAFASELKELNMPYKYDSKIFNGRYTDFAINLEEFNCGFCCEILGNMGDSQYINRTGEKIKEYAFNGYLLGRDLLLIAATKDYMPSSDIIKQNIVTIVNAIAELYVIKNDTIVPITYNGG